MLQQKASRVQQQQELRSIFGARSAWIAGKGIARYESLIAVIRYGVQLAPNDRAIGPAA